MNDKKRKALESAGFQIGDAGDFLALTDDERALVNLRAAASRAVCGQRKKRNVTQAKLAELINSSQSRVAKIEAGASDVSLDLMFRSLFAIGGKVGDVLRIKPELQIKGKVKRSVNHRAGPNLGSSKKRTATDAG